MKGTIVILLFCFALLGEIRGNELEGFEATIKPVPVSGRATFENGVFRFRLDAEINIDISDAAKPNDPKILLFGGRNRSRAISSIEVYHPNKPEANYKYDVTMEEHRFGHSSVLLPGGSILTVGGFNRRSGRGWGSYLQSGEIFNPESQTTRSVGFLNSAREAAGAALLNGVPYICGGSSSLTTVHNSCERYQADVWEYVAPMNTKRSSFQMVALDGKLYSIGGRSESRFVISSVERYTPSTDEWDGTSVPPLIRARLDHAAAVLANRIYVCGGETGSTIYNSCEAYSPESNRWQFGPTMNEARQELSLVAIDSRLIAFGPGKSVETLEIRNGTWKPAKSLIHLRQQATAVLIP